MQIDRIDCLDIPSCTQIFSCSPVFSAISRATLAIIGTFILFKNFVKKTENKWQVKVMLPCLKSCRPEGLSACLYAEKFLQKFGRNSYCFNLVFCCIWKTTEYVRRRRVSYHFAHGDWLRNYGGCFSVLRVVTVSDKTFTSKSIDGKIIVGRGGGVGD